MKELPINKIEYIFTIFLSINLKESHCNRACGFANEKNKLDSYRYGIVAQIK